MVYYDKTGRRIFVPIRRSVPTDVPGLDKEKAWHIRDVVVEYPRLAPSEVYTAIRYLRRREDITIAMVRYVLSLDPNIKLGYVQE